MALQIKHQKAKLRARLYRQECHRLMKSMTKSQANPEKQVTVERNDNDYHKLMDRIEQLEDEVEDGKGAIPTMDGRKFNASLSVTFPTTCRSVKCIC